MLRKQKIVHSLKLENIHSGGRSYGYAGKNKIYVDRGIPHETVDVVLKRTPHPFRVGTITNITITSPARVQPFCKHAGYCGGCNWQHMDYTAQLQWKKQILINALQKYEIETPNITEVTASPLLQGYRNKVEYAFNATCIDPENNTTQQGIGFHVDDLRDTVFPVSKCFLLPEYTQQIAQKARDIAIDMCLPFYHYHERSGLLRSLTIRVSSTEEIMLILGITHYDTRIISYINQLLTLFPSVTSAYYAILDTPEKSLASGVQHIAGKIDLTEQLEDLRLRVSPNAFYQPNSLQALAVYKQVVEYANLQGNELVYDLYTGIGSIACFVAKKARKIIGIEGNPFAVSDARYNAVLNNIDNAYFYTGDILKTFTPDFTNKHGKPDVVILDPPRSGTLIEIKKTMLHATPEKIIYVSCNPVSLAWDLKQLTEKYKVQAIQAFDMFPYTHHVETVVCLLRH